MLFSLTALLAVSLTIVSAEHHSHRRHHATSSRSYTSGGSGSAGITPHDVYGSSAGVPGCKININRVAYWPSAVSCDDICVKVTNKVAGRSVFLLKIDQSQGSNAAHDISYDAYNYLKTGQSATVHPITGGPETWDYQYVDPSNCADLMDGGKLPLEAVPSMNYLVSCLAQPNSFVAKNHVLYNIWDSICRLGADEVSTINYPAENQPVCPSGFGVNTKELGKTIYNIEYRTGKKVKAAGY
ncbi:hypothetical protein T439DRAFT_327139 [Meredithblackwellia eburnea MCA 4105]